MKHFKFRLNLIEDDDTRILHGNITYIIAFVIPVIMFIALYYVREIYPFGDNCYLRSDMYHQYAPFFKELWRKITSGESLNYSWDIGMGTNFTALYAYYLASPSNWLIALFPERYIIEVMNAIIIIKAALASTSFTYYISRRFHNKSCTIALFGVFYGMSGFIAAYSWNIMWLDCIVVFPLIMLGLERLVNENKCLLYCVSLGFCIYTNYYISIMVCISIVLYYIVLMFNIRENKCLKVYLKKFFNFCLYSLLAGGLAACLLLPVMYAFTLSASSSSTFPQTVSNYFSVVSILCRHLINIPVHLGLDHFPNIYCGVMVFLLIPLYIMNSKASSGEKVGKCILLLIFLTSYNLNITNYIWHGFHYPNSLPARQSFIYIFFVLSMCYEGFKDIKSYSKKQLTYAFAAAFGLMLFLEQCGLEEMYEWKTVYISAGFIIIYALLMLFYNRNRLKTPLLLFVLFASSIIEVTVNMEKTGISTTGRTAYLLDNNAVDSLLEKVSAEDTDFYRIEKSFGLKTKNDSAWHGYHSISTFSSTAPSGITDLLGYFGCEHSMNAYAFNGSTLATSSIFNVKYVISNKLLPESSLFSFYYGNDGEFLYKNNYTLPVGFIVSSDIEDEWIASSAYNGIEVQNSFFKLNTGIENVFEQIYDYRSDVEVTVDVPKDAHMYAVVRNTNCDSVTVTINGKLYNYPNLKNGRHIIDMGYLKTTDSVTLTGDTSMNATVYAMDTDKFIHAYNVLNSGGMRVTDYSETSIKGTIDTAKDGIVFFSIPYDAGWRVKVDGKKVSTFAIKDAVLGINMTAGEHTIEMSYLPVNLIPGIMITAASILILAALTIFTRLVQNGRIGLKNAPAFVQIYFNDDSYCSSISSDDDDDSPDNGDLPDDDDSHDDEDDSHDDSKAINSNTDS